MPARPACRQVLFAHECLMCACTHADAPRRRSLPQANMASVKAQMPAGSPMKEVMRQVAQQYQAAQQREQQQQQTAGGGDSSSTGGGSGGGDGGVGGDPTTSAATSSLLAGIRLS